MKFLPKITNRFSNRRGIFPAFFGNSFLVLLLLLVSCNVTKKLEPGQYLVEKVDIENFKETKIPKGNFEAFIRQKPNRKFFGFHFYVWWYTRFNQEKITRKRLARNERYDKKNADKVKRFEIKNARREKKGKTPRIPKLKDKESPLVIESIRDIGEAPVILDSSLTEQTRTQLSKYLFSKGFFNNKVTDSVYVDVKKKRKKKKVTVKYFLIPKAPYVINRITYQMDDEKVGQFILSDTLNTLVQRGMNYDAEVLVKERQRITNKLLNEGYYYFENAYINFDVDSNYNNNTVSLNLHLKKFSREYSSNSDSLILVNHTRYKIDRIYVITEPTFGNLRDAKFTDTLYRKHCIFLMNKPLAYRSAIITNNVDIMPEHYFRKDTAEITYKALQGLGIFKVTIQFLKSTTYSNRLDCYILCNPLIKQSITAETEGINTSGNLGVDGSLVYQNKNFFRGGELVEFKMQGAFIAQQQFNKEKEVDLTNISEIHKTFNTLQFGPEVTFSVPRAFFPFSLFPFKKEMTPRTFVKSSLNYQARAEFSRVITDVDYGLNFRTHNYTLKHEIIPFEAYLVRASLTQEFRDSLANYNDAFLLNSFLDHITTLSRYGITYISKENTNTSKRPVHYIRWDIQSSGNILRQYFKMAGGPQDSLGRYLLFGIPFAQFLRTSADYRIYVPIRNRSRIVYRIAGGIGKPLANLNVLPYEQSFFSGGPNSIRAWRARTLGPGGYRPPEGNLTRFDKIGDLQLEGNFEYRFHIIKSLNGALFVDAGNIWRLEKDLSKPNGEFVVTKFYEQIAIGSGIGLRLDLNFFVLRFDFAVPLRDPKYDSDERWRFKHQPLRQLVVNFGIGYPF